MKFYLHGTGLDQQTASFNKVKDYIILNIQSKFFNGSDIAESIYKEVILYLSKETPIKRILAEYEPIRAESDNDYFKATWNIQIENQVKI